MMFSISSPPVIIGSLTAEETLEGLRQGLIQQIELVDQIIRPLYPRATEAQQILMMGPLDRAREAERLLEALACAFDHLAEHPEPQHDPYPPKRDRTGQ